ncbi:MAG TPA: hypothetical protein VGP62_27575 [Bryobacteraceae bacterium]|jgi:hypothetical protein|nr:hypothetical protein [Bryobacteraceae bacterium]
MFFRVSMVLLAIAALGVADSLTLRSGQIVRGEYLGGDARHIKMAVGDRVETYSVEDVSDLSFGGGQRMSSDSDRRDNNDRRDNGVREVPPAGQAPPAVSGMVVPDGTSITVRMIDPVNSEQSRLGDTFRASVDEPVMVDGQVAIPRGADAITKLVEDQQSGKIAGKTVLTLVLQQVLVNGRMIDLTSGDVSQSSGSRGARSAKVIGGAAALGAIIGALAGGGKGAAIGAGSGAAVGTGAEVLTKGQTVKIPSETRLTFILQQPAQL